MRQQLAKWLKYKSQLEAFKKLELEARKTVIEDVLRPAGLIKDEGTVNFEEDNYLFKATFRMNYKVADNEKLAVFLATLPAWQRAQIIQYTPTVMLTGYRKLDAKQIRQLNRCLEITPGIPGLSAEAK